nr:hypothetical protein NCPCFENI_00571 [Cupriavidus sp.]
MKAAKVSENPSSVPTILRLLACGLGLAVIVGCGQKGPLTLPAPEQPPSPARPAGAP